jgi:hypothetical protein
MSRDPGTPPVGIYVFGICLLILAFYFLTAG